MEEVLGRVAELSPHYQLVVSREGTLDELEVRTEVTNAFFRSVGGAWLSDGEDEADHARRAPPRQDRSPHQGQHRLHDARDAPRAR